jgi:hypothetical protein
MKTKEKTEHNDYYRDPDIEEPRGAVELLQEPSIRSPRSRYLQRVKRDAPQRIPKSVISTLANQKSRCTRAKKPKTRG